MKWPWHRIIWLLVFLLFAGGSKVWTQNQGSVAERCAELVQEGRYYLESGRTDQAIQSFEKAHRLPPNQHSTVALYLCGLSWLYAGEYQVADDYFTYFIDQFPVSRYTPEARYHLALIRLSSRGAGHVEQSIQTLWAMSQHSADPELARLADNALRNWLFYDVEFSRLKLFVLQWPHPVPKPLAEALCFRLMEAGEKAAALAWYQQYLRNGGETSAYVQALFQTPAKHYSNPDNEIIHIAVLLPLDVQRHLADTLNQINGLSGKALSFLEGFLVAVERHFEQSERRVLLEVHDTGFAGSRAGEVLNRLEIERPDLMVGGMAEAEIIRLAEWADQRGVPLVVPDFAKGDFLAYSPFIFMAHPSVRTHGREMALYARDSLQVSRALVWSDGRPLTEELAGGFMDAFENRGGKVIFVRTEETIQQDSTASRVRRILQSAILQGVELMYLPHVDNEALSGLILSMAGAPGLVEHLGHLKVLGAPQWYTRYETIDRDLKSLFELTFSVGSLTQPDDHRLQNFERRYATAYQALPEENAIQGFDLGNFLMEVLDRYNRRYMALPDWLRLYEAFPGLHLNYYFGGGQINRFVNIARFGPEGIELINRTQPPSIQEISIPDGIVPANNPAPDPR